MASLPLPPPPPRPPPTQPIGGKAKTFTSNSANLTKIPSWISLNRSPPQSPHAPPVSAVDVRERPKGGLVENIHLVSLAKQGRFEEAREFFRTMEASGVPIKTHYYQHLFEACETWESLPDGKFFHEEIRKGLERDPDGFLGNCLIRMYCKCGSLCDAREVFDAMPVKGRGAWRIMFSGYVQNRMVAEAICLDSALRAAGIEPDPLLFVSLITELSAKSDLELGKQVHSYVTKTGLVPDVSVNTALVNMYMKCGYLQSSLRIFNRMDETNAVTWTGLMVGYMQEEKQEEVLALFERMMFEGVEMDQYVFSIVLKACSGLTYLQTGRQIHGLIIKHEMDSDVSAGTPLVDLYVKCGLIRDARAAFERISHPNEFSWSALITGYSQMGQYEECLETFRYLRSRDITMNSFIYTSVFQVCATLSDSSSGCQLHGDALKRGLVSELYGESALVTMYSRSGNLDYARRTFNLIDKPDTVAWTAIIAGCAYHGYASEALSFFRMMQSSGIKPNAITFVGILTACSHSGLVSEAKQCLDSMETVFGVAPTKDHFNCMVDIYCRAGRLEEAFSLIKSGSFEPDAMTWKILLSGCTSLSNVELGQVASENLLQMEPEDTSAYVLSFNMHASSGQWDEAASVRKLMNERGIVKEVGCSWIGVKGKVHRFIVGDRHHPQTEEIYSKLKELESLTDFVECTSPVDNVSLGMHDERKNQLLDHSEKLAIAFGIITTPDNSPITVFKNLRICCDCHYFFKLVSKTTMREITVRDSSRFHHFSDGVCSCKDYW